MMLTRKSQRNSKASRSCASCCASVPDNAEAIICDFCSKPEHVYCNGMSRTDYSKFTSIQSASVLFMCSVCTTDCRHGTNVQCAVPRLPFPLEVRGIHSTLLQGTPNGFSRQTSTRGTKLAKTSCAKRPRPPTNSRSSHQRPHRSTWIEHPSYIYTYYSSVTLAHVHLPGSLRRRRQASNGKALPTPRTRHHLLALLYLTLSTRMETFLRTINLPAYNLIVHETSYCSTFLKVFPICLRHV